MESNIDAFLLFCDNEIAEEGAMKDTIDNIWSSIKKTFEKIQKWFRKLLNNLNYFKDAELDSDMNDDLKKVLVMSQPRTENNFKIINLYYKICSILKKDNTKVNHFVVGEVYEDITYREQFDELVKRSSIDTQQAISTAKNSAEYKRLQKNRYTNKKKSQIPLNTIQQDLSSCNKLMNSMSKELTKIESESSKMKNEKGKSLNKKMHVFMRTVIAYCTFRIGVLGRYLRYAKLSIKNKFIKNDNVNQIKTKSDLSLHVPKVTTKIEPVKYKELKDAFSVMKTTDDYSEYKENYDIFTKALGIENHVIKLVKMIDTTSTISVAHLKDDGEEINVRNSHLYHASDNPNLKQLNPFFRSKSGTTFFPTPRIYMHLNVPGNRLGSTIQNSEKKGDTVLYELAEKIDTAYVDREIGKTAVYVNSDKPLKIKKINYDDWKRSKEIDLGFDE